MLLLPASLFFLWIWLVRFSLGLHHLGAESFSLASVRRFTPKSHPMRFHPLYSKNIKVTEAAKDGQKSPFQHEIQQAKGLVVTAGLISALSFATPLDNVLPPANAVSTREISSTSTRLSAVEVSTAPSPSSSLSLASTMEVTTPNDSSSTTPAAATMMLPSSIAKPGMSRVASIMDLAGVLDPQTDVPPLVQAIQTAQRKTGTELQIVVVNKIQKGYTPKRMATTLFNQWHLGTSQKNNGVLILVVLDERRTEIEVGKALNDKMNANWCTLTLQQTASPAFRRQEYGKGLLATVQKVSERLVEVDRGGIATSHKGSGLLNVNGQALLNDLGVCLAILVMYTLYLQIRYPIGANCPECNADMETWTDVGWVTTKEATDQEEGLKELRGVCANCGHVYTETHTIRRYDGSTVDADGNVSYYYDNDSDGGDSGGSSDGGGGGDSW